MPDAIIEITGYTVDLSGTIAPNTTVTAVFSLPGQADIVRSATSDASGYVHGSVTLPAAGTWLLELLWGKTGEDSLIDVPGGSVMGAGIVAVPAAAGKPKHWKTSAATQITDKTKLNAARKKANLPPLP